MPDLDQLFQWVQGGNSSLVQSILLGLIWLNVRSLKHAFVKLEENHDERLMRLELKLGIEQPTKT